MGTSAGWLTIGAVGLSLILSLMALAETVRGHGEVAYGLHRWLTVGQFEMNVGILMDPLTAIMLVVVTGVSLDGADILARLHERGRQPRVRALLRLYVAVHSLDGPGSFWRRG